MPSDNMSVDCEHCRTSLSARMDGEAEAAPPAEVDAHLRHCASCQTWEAEARALTRSLRVGVVRPTPDLTDAVLARVPLPSRRLKILRTALAATAAGQLGLSLAQMLGLGDHGAHTAAMMASHLFNESTAWNLALGLGMLWAALRTRTVAGMLPVFSAFVAVLTGFSVHDLVTGSVPLSRVASHGVLAVGLLLLFVIHRHTRTMQDPSPGTSDAAYPDGSVAASGSPEAAAQQHDGRPPLRPTAQRRAA